MYKDAMLNDSDATPNSADEVSARLCENYSLETIQVDRKGTHPDREQDPDNEDLSVVFSVPFTGDRKLLEHRPDSQTSVRVEGEIQDNKIVVTVAGTLSEDTSYFQRKFNWWFNNMKMWLDGANKQADDFNGSLHAKIKVKIAERAERIRRANEMMSGLDFPEMTDDSEESN